MNSADYASALIARLGLYPHDQFQRVVTELDAALYRDATLYVCGNGGSHATASHMVADFSQLGWPIVCLGDNLPRLTATANDATYADVYADALRPVLKKQDVLIVFTGSGNSENVIKAVRYASDHCTTIAITGMGGGRIAPLVDVALIMPSQNMQHIEDLHLITVHMLADHYRSRS